MSKPAPESVQKRKKLKKKKRKFVKTLTGQDDIARKPAPRTINPPDRAATETADKRGPVKEALLEILQYAIENIGARASSLIKLQGCNLIKKETLAQVFSCEICEISNNSLSYRAPPAASVKDLSWLFI